MPLDSLTAAHIAAQNGNPAFEPQRQNNGLLVLNTGIGSGTSGLDELIRLSLASFPIPKVQTNIIEIPWLNETRKVAGKTTYEDLTVVCKDYVDRDLAKQLWEWRQKVHNHTTGKTGFAKDYKKNGLIYLYAPDGSTERKYQVQGAWPSTLDAGDIDMSGDDVVQITFTMTIDKMLPMV